MANALITPTHVLNEGLMHLENELVLGSLISNDYSDEFKARGETISIRRPAQYSATMNNLDITSTIQDIEQATVPVTLSKTATIAIKLTSKERTLSFDRLSEDIIKPAMIEMKDTIEQDIAANYYKFYNFAGTPGTIPSTFSALADAGAFMDDMAMPMSGRIAVHSSQASAKLADGLKGVYVQSIAKTAIEQAKIGEYADFTNYKSQHAPTHTVGLLGGTPLVNGGAQNVTYAASKNTWSQSLITDGWSNSITGLLTAGDVFTIAGVFSVNPVSKQSTAQLQTFTVLAVANSNGSGQSTLSISPPMITSGPFQTVTAAPADNAAITVKTGTAATGYKQSLLMLPKAMTLVTRALDIPQGQGVKTVTKSGNRVTVSCTEFVNGMTLDQIMRFDMLFETTVIDPRLGLRLTN